MTDLSQAFSQETLQLTKVKNRCDNGAPLEELFADYMVLRSSITENMDHSTFNVLQVVDKYKTQMEGLAHLKKEIETWDKKIQDVLNMQKSIEDSNRNLMSHLTIPNEARLDLQTKYDAYNNALAQHTSQWVQERQEEQKKRRAEKEAYETNSANVREMFSIGAKELISKDHIHSHACPVCFDREVSMVHVPCGHTICDTCSSNFLDKCGMCRRKIDVTMKIYFSV